MNKYNLNKDQIIDSLDYDEKTKEYIKKNLIFLCVSGSHAYGMNTPESDMDIRGIFIAGPESIIGTDKIDQFENSTNDIVIYELRKILTLVAEQNPNMQEIPWVDEEDIIFATDEYWSIRKNREKLLSSLVKQRYSCYAVSQIHRVKNHEKWLTRELNGEFNKKPEMIDYCRLVNRDGFTITIKDKDILEYYIHKTFLTHETNTIFKVWTIQTKEKPKFLPKFLRPYKIMKNINGWIDNENCTFYFKESIDKIERNFEGLLFFSKDEFNQVLDQYNKWKEWKENRNEKRHKLEEKYKYDTKFASHSIRLLRMGYEILTEGKVLVKRPDAQELLDIRNGKWTYEQLLSYAEDMDKVKLEEAYKNTKLPRSVDRVFLNELLINTYLKYWSKV